MCQLGVVIPGVGPAQRISQASRGTLRLDFTLMATWLGDRLARCCFLFHLVFGSDPKPVTRREDNFLVGSVCRSHESGKPSGLALAPFCEIVKKIFETPQAPEPDGHFLWTDASKQLLGRL
jgi:hypothetical protein